MEGSDRMSTNLNTLSTKMLPQLGVLRIYARLFVDILEVDLSFGNLLGPTTILFLLIFYFSDQIFY